MKQLYINEEYEVTLQKDLYKDICKGCHLKLLELFLRKDGIWYATVQAKGNVFILPIDFFERRKIL